MVAAGSVRDTNRPPLQGCQCPSSGRSRTLGVGISPVRTHLRSVMKDSPSLSRQVDALCSRIFSFTELMILSTHARAGGGHGVVDSVALG